MNKGLYLELFCWISAIIMLAFLPSSEKHFTLCPFYNLGFGWCPGCGLGRSINSIFQGNFTKSFHQHWFGFPALLILVFRIFELSNKIRLN